MIRRDEVISIGRTLKPHGLKGELTAATDADIDFGALRCIVLDMDGILVPFFIGSWRPKGADTCLLTIDGVADEASAAELSGKELYILAADAAAAGIEAADGDADVLYLSELPGYTVVDTDGRVAGTISHVDDSTQNVVIYVTTPAGKEILMPFAEELVAEIDTQNKSIMLDLPEGLFDLN